LTGPFARLAGASGLRSRLDPQQQPASHEGTERLDGDRVGQGREPGGDAVAGDQARLPLSSRLEQENAPAGQAEDPAGLLDRHRGAPERSVVADPGELGRPPRGAPRYEVADSGLEVELDRVPGDAGSEKLFSRRPIELVEKLGGQVRDPRTIKSLYRLRVMLFDENSEPAYSTVAIGYPIVVEEAGATEAG
jgi:hypothetical protein